MPSMDGEKAYELVEVDDFGNPILKEMDHANKRISRTEKKIGPGLRAPDYIRGHTKPFNYHQWNALRAKGKLKKKRR